MTITYPLTAPTSPTAQRLSMSGEFVVGENRSIFTLSEEVFEHTGQLWRATLTLPPMTRDNAEQWITFCLALNGKVGTFVFGDPAGQTPRGTVGGDPVVDGAGQQLSKSLATRGWNTSETVLKRGDYIQLGTRLHKVLTDASSDESGEVTLDLFPRVRDVQVDGATIITSNTKGIWRLAENSFNWSIDLAQVYGMNLSIVEAINT